MEFRFPNDDRWLEIPPSLVLRWIAYESPVSKFRVAHKTININGHEVSEPVREPLADGQHYYLVAPTVVDFDEFEVWTWDGHEADNNWLELGLIHLTREDAKTHAKALLSFTKVKG